MMKAARMAREMGTKWGWWPRSMPRRNVTNTGVTTAMSMQLGTIASCQSWISAVCYTWAALHHLAVTWVLGFSDRSVWTSASARALCLPSITVQGFHMYLGILDPWILGSGSAGRM